MGHQLNDKTSRLGATQSIQADSDGAMFYGTADYRREGSGVAIPIK